MEKISLVVIIISLALTSIARPAMAESAPVYDADSLPQQFDDNAEVSADLPLPPPPDQDTFIPVTPEQSINKSASQNTNATPKPPPQVLNREPNHGEIGDATATYAPEPPTTPEMKPAIKPMSPEQRLRRIEQQITNMQSSETAAHIQSLQDQVQSLRSQVEQLTHQFDQMQIQQKSQLDQLQTQQKAQLDQMQTQHKAQLDEMQTQQKTMFSDFDKRLNQNVKSGATNSNNTDAALADANADIDANTKLTRKEKLIAKRKAALLAEQAKEAKRAAADQPNVAEEQQVYQTAYNLIKAKKYNEAVNALEAMLQKYPSGQFAANAHYWLGELFGLMGKHDQALIEFTTVVRNHPESPRVSDAQLKVGLIYASQLKWVDAKTAFKKVINRYPGTASARLANDQLKQIERAGN